MEPNPHYALRAAHARRQGLASTNDPHARLPDLTFAAQAGYLFRQGMHLAHSSEDVVREYEGGRRMKDVLVYKPSTE